MSQTPAARGQPASRVLQVQAVESESPLVPAHMILKGSYGVGWNSSRLPVFLHVSAENTDPTRAGLRSRTAPSRGALTVGNLNNLNVIKIQNTFCNHGPTVLNTATSEVLRETPLHHAHTPVHICTALVPHCPGHC